MGGKKGYFPSLYKDSSMKPNVGKTGRDGSKIVEYKCEKCGHHDNAHCDRNGVRECLVKGCRKCRDKNLLTLVQVARLFGEPYCSINRITSADPPIPRVLDADDNVAFRKSVLPEITRRVNKTRVRRAARTVRETDSRITENRSGDNTLTNNK